MLPLVLLRVNAKIHSIGHPIQVDEAQKQLQLIEKLKCRPQRRTTRNT